MGVDTTFVIPVPQTGYDDWNSVRKDAIHKMMQASHEFRKFVEAGELGLPFDLETQSFPPFTTGLILVQSSCRFLPPRSPRSARSAGRWNHLRDVMQAIHDASEALGFTNVWYTDDGTELETINDLVIAASKNHAHLVDPSLIEFMDKTFSVTDND